MQMNDRRVPKFHIRGQVKLYYLKIQTYTVQLVRTRYLNMYICICNTLINAIYIYYTSRSSRETKIMWLMATEPNMVESTADS